ERCAETVRYRACARAIAARNRVHNTIVRCGECRKNLCDADFCRGKYTPSKHANSFILSLGALSMTRLLPGQKRNFASSLLAKEVDESAQRRAHLTAAWIIKVKPGKGRTPILQHADQP